MKINMYLYKFSQILLLVGGCFDIRNIRCTELFLGPLKFVVSRVSCILFKCISTIEGAVSKLLKFIY